ncbi:hypothetical protein RHMOL_Rhmol04G0353500 [Rhododendron molle]|uniref:Uncharacterized protein n=1 Tax=Rhododendron molle TaxID=49168 RepID=A0ACC0PA69_RHOML|nr:hypothetical protein RHMOL_Rhmol04G0353500 [Rhododendron molle]
MVNTQRRGKHGKREKGKTVVAMVLVTLPVSSSYGPQQLWRIWWWYCLYQKNDCPIKACHVVDTW